MGTTKSNGFSVKDKKMARIARALAHPARIAILNVLATTNWRRPICFTSPYGELGFGPYLRQVGMIYTLVPVRNQFEGDIPMDLEKTKPLLLEKFRGGNANVKGVYFDEENRRHLNFIRSAFGQAAIRLSLQGRKEEANAILNKAESQILPEALPYAMVSRDNRHNYFAMVYLEAAYKAGHTALVNKMKAALQKDLDEQVKYYDYLKTSKPEFYGGDLAGDDSRSREYLQKLKDLEKQYNPGTIVNELPGKAADSLPDSLRKP